MKAYRDPLHIPREDYTLWHKGSTILILNKDLLDQQNVWDNLTKILELHSERLHLEDMMKDVLKEWDKAPKFKRADLEDVLNLYDCLYTLIEFELQDAWGFPRDSAFHRFWDRPGCDCPKLDNEDRYRTDTCIINNQCKLHGSL